MVYIKYMEDNRKEIFSKYLDLVLQGKGKMGAKVILAEEYQVSTRYIYRLIDHFEKEQGLNLLSLYGKKRKQK